MSYQRTILCDVDEVCAALLPEWVRRYNIRWGDDLDCSSVTAWDVCRFVDEECGERVYDILNDPDLYYSVAPVPGALEGVITLRELGYRVVFVSACPPGTMDDKEDWLVRHGFLIDENDYVPARDKGLIRGDLLIDDGPHNSPTILFDQPHNRHVLHPYRARSWEEVVEFVKFLAP